MVKWSLQERMTTENKYIQLNKAKLYNVDRYMSITFDFTQSLPYKPEQSNMAGLVFNLPDRVT